MTNQELNEAVAKKFGWKSVRACVGVPPGNKTPIECPDYSGSIQAAWEIVEHLKYAFSLARDGQYPLWDAWFAGGEHVQDDTAPLAICKAFLKLP